MVIHSNNISYLERYFSKPSKECTVSTPKISGNVTNNYESGDLDTIASVQRNSNKRIKQTKDEFLLTGNMEA